MATLDTPFYRPDEKCIKCDWTESRVAFDEVSAVLVVTCTRCGWRRDRNPLDARPCPYKFRPNSLYEQRCTLLIDHLEPHVWGEPYPK